MSVRSRITLGWMTGKGGKSARPCVCEAASTSSRQREVRWIPLASYDTWMCFPFQANTLFVNDRPYQQWAFSREMTTSRLDGKRRKKTLYVKSHKLERRKEGEHE